MNLILLFDADFISPSHARLSGRRLLHLNNVLKVEEGQSLTVGKINGLMGKATVTAINLEALEMEVAFTQPPPAPLPLTLIIPMIRPPMFKRLLFHATSLGVKKIIVLNFNRVDKGLWNSSSLRPEEIQAQLVLGLEQAKDTMLPEVIIRQKFKPFVEDELPLLSDHTLKFIAHPGGDTPSQISNEPVTLVIGPEGGLIDFEVKRFIQMGFQPLDLGPRILRVDTVLPYLVGLFWG
jgi:16S rRNA (uracil1498-N3)-methyltransferase